MLAIFWARVSDHVLVVGRLVVDVAGDVLLFEAADAVLQARRAGDRPRAHEHRVALVGQELPGSPLPFSWPCRRSLFGPVGCLTSIFGSLPTSGIIHGSAPLAM